MKNGRRQFVRWVWVAVVAGVLGAAPSGCSANTASGGGRADLITRNDITERGLITDNAYDVVQRLRPRWLSPRGSSTFSNPDPAIAVVYLDGARFGEPDLLRQIRAEEISTIQFLSGTDATTRFGTNHGGGAILVATAR